jgi:hypothetical protein
MTCPSKPGFFADDLALILEERRSGRPILLFVGETSQVSV